MTPTELENLLLLADRMAAKCDLKQAEYWKGYRSGIQYYFQNGEQEYVLDHYSVADIARKSGCRDVHAYTRGFGDGCKGLKPKDAY